jgi:hypothetical protein
MTDRIWNWLADEIGPRLPTIHIQRCELSGWSWWTAPGDRLQRWEVLLFTFIVALLLAGCKA